MAEYRGGGRSIRPMAGRIERPSIRPTQHCGRRGGPSDNECSIAGERTRLPGVGAGAVQAQRSTAARMTPMLFAFPYAAFRGVAYEGWVGDDRKCGERR